MTNAMQISSTEHYSDEQQTWVDTHEWHWMDCGMYSDTTHRDALPDEWRAMQRGGIRVFDPNGVEIKTLEQCQQWTGTVVETDFTAIRSDDLAMICKAIDAATSNIAQIADWPSQQRAALANLRQRAHTAREAAA